MGTDEIVYRICEENGRLCRNWLAGLKPPDPLSALERGGFSERSDAKALGRHGGDPTSPATPLSLWLPSCRRPAANKPKALSAASGDWGHLRCHTIPHLAPYKQTPPLQPHVSR